jgi:hypothetical protein
VIRHHTAAALPKMGIPCVARDQPAHLTVSSSSRVGNRRDRRIHRGVVEPDDATADEGSRWPRPR